MTINNVYITNTASISCAGLDNDELFENICTSNSGIKQDKDYFYEASPAIGKIDNNKSFEENLIEQCSKILQSSSLENYRDTLLIVGSSVGGMTNTENIYFKENSFKNIDPKLHNINSISHILKDHFKFYDCISFSTACTSSANALGYAYEVLSKGVYKNVLVIGVDQLCKTTVGGFLSLGVLSSNPCKPFDKDRDGMNVAEAIACLLIETTSNDNSIEICGVGYSSDAYHMTQPHPDGIGAKSSMENALKLAKLNHGDILYINAHGTGTIANDLSEAKAIENLFPNLPYVSSTKSITGHTLGAAGAIEAIISCEVLKRQMIPKSTGINEVENENINISIQNKSMNIDYVMSNSFAFGGNNCSLIFGRVK
jgi:3-oxoacyl-[acyl-carrier-protein] synthase-1